MKFYINNTEKYIYLIYNLYIFIYVNFKYLWHFEGSKAKIGILGAARRRKVQNLLLLCRIAIGRRDRYAIKKKQYFVTIVYVSECC